MDRAYRSEEHSLAKMLRDAFAAREPDKEGRLTIHKKGLPAIIASPASAERIAAFLSGMAWALEARSIGIAPGKSAQESLRIIKGDDVIFLFIEEGIEDYELPPSPEQKRQPSWTWNNQRVRPTGKLSFRLRAHGTLSGRCKWTESGNSDAAALLPKIIAKIEGLFEYWDRKREERRLDSLRWEEKQKKDAERQKQEEHREKIAEAKASRATALYKAAELFREYQRVCAFLEACESRWAEAGQLSESQREWLQWARVEAERINPLLSYPIPEKDGSFDESGIPIGGPYPESQSIPLSMLLEEIRKLLKDHRPSSYHGYGW